MKTRGERGGREREEEREGREKKTCGEEEEDVTESTRLSVGHNQRRGNTSALPIGIVHTVLHDGRSVSARVLSLN